MEQQNKFLLENLVYGWSIETVRFTTGHKHMETSIPQDQKWVDKWNKSNITASFKIVVDIFFELVPVFDIVVDIFFKSIPLFEVVIDIFFELICVFKSLIIIIVTSIP